MGGLGNPTGLLSLPVAHESFADTLAHLVLARLAHNYIERMGRRAEAAVPRHLGRAEAFIEANAARPIAVADIAAAAGCGTRTLQDASRRFRDTTPLTAVTDARLRAARAALHAADDSEPVYHIVRRFGFTNISRFTATYRRRFGEDPQEICSRR